MRRSCSHELTPFAGPRDEARGRPPRDQAKLTIAERDKSNSSTRLRRAEPLSRSDSHQRRLKLLCRHNPIRGDRGYDHKSASANS